jgi:hypothetical protein
VFTVIGKLPQTFTSPALDVLSGNVPAGHTVTIDVDVPRPKTFPFNSAYHKKEDEGQDYRQGWLRKAYVPDSQRDTDAALVSTCKI